jgi:hypothetical protein
MENVEEISVESIDTHSAIPTWSGFEYQGQIAIYWVLQLLNQWNIREIDIENYTLEIEHLEDFEIKYQDKPLTIHQVKSYQNKYSISSYKEAILELMGKAAKYSSIDSIHLHSCCVINEPEKEDLKNVLLETNPSKKKAQFDEYKKLLFDEGKYEEVYRKLNINNNEGDFSKRVIGRLDTHELIKEQIKLFYEQNPGLVEGDFLDTEENINFIFFNLVHEINQLVALGHA